jgi:hypothetical protein
VSRSCMLSPPSISHHCPTFLTISKP